MSALNADFFSATSIGLRPRADSCCFASSLEDAFSSPLDGTPAPSSAL